MLKVLFSLIVVSGGCNQHISGACSKYLSNCSIIRNCTAVSIKRYAISRNFMLFEGSFRVEQKFWNHDDEQLLFKLSSTNVVAKKTVRYKNIFIPILTDNDNKSKCNVYTLLQEERFIWFFEPIFRDMTIRVCRIKVVFLPRSRAGFIDH